MNNDMKFFMSFLEADGDPPDTAMADAASPPPNVPDDTGSESPPDISDDTSSDAPPDFGGDDMSDGDMSDDVPPDFGDNGGGDELGDEGSEESEDGNNKQPMELDEKISAIMNLNLYNRFLTLLTNLGTQMSQIKNNSDMIYTLSPDASELFNQYKNLDTNVRLYLKNSFASENYSKNILFFNKCLNLLKLLNDQFAAYVNKGIKERK